MDKQYVISRIDDWERRLNDLYSQIEEWYRQLPPNPVRELYVGSILQPDEPLMRQFEVPPRMLPTRAVVYGKNRVYLVPGALWVIGANGLVNVATNTHHFATVDLGGAEQPPDWQIETSQLRQVYRPFDQQVFESLVLHQAILAA